MSPGVHTKGPAQAGTRDTRRASPPDIPPPVRDAVAEAARVSPGLRAAVAPRPARARCARTEVVDSAVPEHRLRTAGGHDGVPATPPGLLRRDGFRDPHLARDPSRAWASTLPRGPRPIRAGNVRERG